MSVKANQAQDYVADFPLSEVASFRRPDVLDAIDGKKRHPMFVHEFTGFGFEGSHCEPAGRLDVKRGCGDVGDTAGNTSLSLGYTPKPTPTR
ncbi:hypothetical protein ACH4CE_34885 [Streptomyces gelaticus]|uniref:hypothetical protein n=1 Tax=Streptomyces gelaticus TaxID=285446 RepID=UPI0037B25571